MSACCDRGPSRPGEREAYLRVRVTGEPRRDGSITVYRSNGTALRVGPSELVDVDAASNAPAPEAWAGARWYERAR